MLDSIIIFSNEAPVEIHGGEGGSGPLFWKRLVGGVDLHGDWESFEYARLPAGGVIGEHVHTRTEELYFVSSGRATMYLDGSATVVGPGDLILTPLNGRHRAVVDQGEDWEFIVAEVLPPEVLGREASEGASAVRRRAEIVNLHTERAERLDRVFSGPWSAIALEQVPAGGSRVLAGDREEHAVYVLSGEGTARTDMHSAELGPGRGFAVPRAGKVTVSSGSQPLELFVVSVRL